MLTTVQIRNGQKAARYFQRELSGTSDYYASHHGVWYGKGAKLLGLPGEVTKQDFVALVNNQVPRTGERLTARMNTTRTVVRWETNPETGKRVPVERELANRRVCVDFTFSVPKSVSMYLARTQDAEVEKLVHEALRETLDDMEADVCTRVRRGDADHDRSSGNAVWACFVHRTTRPVSGRADPHWHAHCLLMNATHDDDEGRWKAAQLGNVVAKKGFYQAAFHSRVAEKLMAAGHRLRRTGRDFDMDVFTEQEVRVFCKRTEQIEALERRLRDELQQKVEAKVRAAAKRGELLDFDEVYAAEKAKLGAEYREAKNQMRLQGAALETDWASQLAPGRWEAITPEASRQGQSIGFLDPETAKQFAIHHAFEKHSTLRETAMATELLKWGIGTIPVKEALGFVRESGVFLRNDRSPGQITTREVYREDKRILSLVNGGKGTLPPIDALGVWQIQSEKIARDAGQTNAIRHVLGSTSLLTGIVGKAGVGKTSVIREAANAIQSLSGEEPVMLAATASAVERLKESDMARATTVANFRDKPELQDLAKGRVVWVDEASLLDNAAMTWLLRFARDNGSRLVVSGDPRQHGAVQRGHPFKMMIDTQTLECARLSKIYRQQNAPELLDIIEDYYAERYEAALAKLEGLGLVRESPSRREAVQQLALDVITELQAGKSPLIIAPIHRDGRDLGQALRDTMREQGLIDPLDHQVTWLESADLSEAQAKDPIHYEPGQLIEFHRQTGPGGFRCGELWEVTRREGATVYVAKDGRERVLPLDRAQDYHVYRRQTMPVAAGEWVLITKNNRAAALTNGQLVRIKAIDETGILLENGRRLDRTKPLHIRQGYTITSQTSQGHEREKMFGLLTVSASSQINAVQMLVSLSRASREARLYTDSFDVLREVAVRPGVGRSALELVEGMPQEREAAPDLQQDAIRMEGHSEVPPVAAYEQLLRERAARKYPNPDPELARKIERTIVRKIEAYRAQEAARTREATSGDDDPTEARRRQRSQSLGHGMGF